MRDIVINSFNRYRSNFWRVGIEIKSHNKSVCNQFTDKQVIYALYRLRHSRERMYRGDIWCLVRSRGLECTIVPFGSLFECYATSLFELSISWQISAFPRTHVHPPNPRSPSRYRSSPAPFSFMSRLQ